MGERTDQSAFDIEVDPDELAEADGRIKDVIQERYRQALNSQPGMCRGAIKMFKALQPRRIWEIIEEYTPPLCRIVMASPVFDPAKFDQIPSPTDEELNSPATYLSNPRETVDDLLAAVQALYGGSATAEVRTPGSGSRMHGYGACVRKFVRKGAVCRSQSIGRHMRYVLRRNVSLHIRFMTRFPPRYPRGPMLLCEGILVDVRKCLSSSLPPPDSKAGQFQTEDAIAASRQTLPSKEHSISDKGRLNGASPFMQGMKMRNKDGVHCILKIMYEEQDNICPCCNQELPPLVNASTGTRNVSQENGVAYCGIRSLPTDAVVHRACQFTWKHYLRKGTFQDTVADGEKYVAQTTAKALADIEHRKHGGHFTLRRARARWNSVFDEIINSQGGGCKTCDTRVAVLDDILRSNKGRGLDTLAWFPAPFPEARPHAGWKYFCRRCCRRWKAYTAPGHARHASTFAVFEECFSSV